MYVCMYTCMYTHTNTHAHTNIEGASACADRSLDSSEEIAFLSCVCVRVRVRVRTRVYVSVCVCMHARMGVLRAPLHKLFSVIITYMCVCVCVCVCVHACTCVCTRARVRSCKSFFAVLLRCGSLYVCARYVLQEDQDLFCVLICVLICVLYESLYVLVCPCMSCKKMKTFSTSVQPLFSLKNWRPASRWW